MSYVPPPNQAPPPQGTPIPPYYGPPTGSQPGDGKATGSLIAGIFSILCCAVLPVGIVGIILANSAKKDGFVGGKMTAGLILSIIGLVLFVIALAYWIIYFLILGFVWNEMFWYDWYNW